MQEMNKFGRLYSLEIFGESHSFATGGIIDGCPSGLDFDKDFISQSLLDRKGNSFATTPRKEDDRLITLSGVKNGKTTGTPISFYILNKSYESKDYNFEETPRPGHADFTQLMKYGKNADISGGGHSSGRLTLPLVVAGSVSLLLLKKLFPNIKIQAEIKEIGGQVDYNELLVETVKRGDSLGGIVLCKISNIPVGIGEPFFDSVESVISHLIFSIPGVKGIEFGAGFASAKMFGSEMNDEILNQTGQTKTNNAGGIVGGITNGNDIIFNVAFRPPASIKLPQKTINLNSNLEENITIKGKHDVCYVLRTKTIIESTVAIALVDLLMLVGQIPRKLE